MPAADEVVAGAAERAALDRLRALTGSVDGPMERHSLRVFLLAEEAARQRSIPVDRELLLVAALLHDAGLYAHRGSAPYVTGSRELVEALAREHGWPADRVRRCAAAVEEHHSRSAKWALGPEVELLRRADVAEVLGERVRPLGVDAAFLRDLDARVPRKGIVRHIAHEVLGELRHRPRSLLRVFRP